MSKVGDIFQVNLSKRAAYVRFAGRLEPGIDILEVLDATAAAAMTPASLGEVAVKFAFLSNVSVLKKHKAFRYIGEGPSKKPETYRFRTRTFGGWTIDDRLVTKLTKEQARLPIWEGLPGDEIVKRLEAQWAPEMDTLDIDADIKRYAKKRDGLSVTVFIKFATKALAKRAARVLSAAGYEMQDSGRRLQVKMVWGDGPSTLSKVESEENRILELCAPYEPLYEGHEVA